jgi:hypothetical protein
LAEGYLGWPCLVWRLDVNSNSNTAPVADVFERAGRCVRASRQIVRASRQIVRATRQSKQGSSKARPGAVYHCYTFVPSCRDARTAE